MSQVEIIFDVSFHFNFYKHLEFPSTTLNNILSSLRSQKQPSRGVLKKRRSENMQQICRRTPIPKCDFNKVALDGCFWYLFSTLYVCWHLPKPFFSNHYCQIFQELRPSQVFYLNDLLVSLPEKERTIFKSLIRTLLCSKVNMRNHRLLYVSCWNRSTVLLNLSGLKNVGNYH